MIDYFENGEGATLDVDRFVLMASVAVAAPSLPCQGRDMLGVTFDTHPEIDAARRARLLRMSPADRLAEGARLCSEARVLLRAGIRARHPTYEPADVDAALIVLLYGEEIYRRVFPDRPMRAP